MRAFQHFNYIGRTVDGQLDILGAFLAPPVYRHQKAVVAGCHRERNDRIVGQRQRSHRQRVRRHGHESQRVAAGLHDGTSHGEGVARAARGGVDEQSIGLIRGEILAVDIHTDGNHR